MTRADPGAIRSARSLAEAQLWAQFDTCECGGLGLAWEPSAIQSGGTGTVVVELASACAQCGRRLRLSFAVPAGRDQPGPYRFAAADDGPSALYDPAEWWAFARQYGAMADRLIAEAGDAPWTDRDAWEQVVGHLWQSAAALEEVLRFLPGGAAAVPAAAFRTPWGADALRSAPEAFTRAALEGERADRLARARRFVASHPAPDVPAGDEPAPPPAAPARSPWARSVAEEQLFLALHPCACGERRFSPSSGVDRAADGARIGWYRGRCVSCGELREFRFREPEELAELPDGAWSTGEDASELIDPGEWWLLVQDMLARHASAPAPERRQDLRHDLRYCVSALEEILLFIPHGARSVPEAAFRSARGRDAWERQRHEFDREVLEAGRRHLLDRLAALEIEAP